MTAFEQNWNYMYTDTREPYHYTCTEEEHKDRYTSSET